MISSTFVHLVVTVAYGDDGKGKATMYLNALPAAQGGSLRVALRASFEGS